jgi:hypothetical protein
MQRNLSEERLSKRTRPHRKHISGIEEPKSTRRYARSSTPPTALEMRPSQLFPAIELLDAAS